MTPEQKERIRELFLAACEKPSREWTEFLQRACGGDELVRKEVESLLARDDDEDTFLQTPALGRTFADARPESLVGQSASARSAHRSPDADTDPSPSASLPERIGSYRILSELGRGGMGVVYLAEQDKPRRQVALKLIPPGVAATDALRRFEHEAQILGRLQHSGIAQVYEAGTANTGFGPQPYFAMELVDGLPLTTFAESRHLGVRARLSLFAGVCDAVHHAHQKGIIHRDLKPANILVTAEGMPKILDFGVARATDSDIQATTLRTDVGQLVGTVSYMSPEQATGDPDELDTRSDVYALGVVLYELLTGQLPYNLQRKLIHEAVRIIREDEPTRLSNINRTLRGDVETIVAKAMEKDKSRRYASASDLAGDVRRFLASEPILARPTTTLYQLRKFAKRNKTLVTAIVAAFATLVIGIVGTTSQAIRATRERNHALGAERVAAWERAEAQRQTGIAKAVNDFLNEDLLGAASPLYTADRDITVREVLDAASKNLAGKFEGEPETAASIHTTLGNTYEYLGEYERAEPHLKKALSLYLQTLGDNHLNTFDAMENLALLHRRHARYSEAEDLFAKSLAGKRALLGDNHFETAVAMNDLAALYHAQGRNDEAERLYLESLAVRRDLFGEKHQETAACECNLANLYEIQGRYEEAVAMHVTALSTRRETLGKEHPDTLMSMNSLAKAYHSRKEYDLAEPLWHEVLDVRRRTLGDEHPDTLKTMNNLAVLYRNSNRYDEAERLFTTVLEAQRRVLGEQHPHTLVSANNLADLYEQMQRHEEAAALFQTTIEGARSSLPEGHWYTGVFLTKYGRCLTSLERFDDAEDALTEARRTLATALGATHDRTNTATSALIRLYDLWGKPDQAAEYRAMLPAEEP